MKSIACAFAFALLTTGALADDLLPPPWRLSNASATVQEWDFNTSSSNLAPDGSIWGSGGSGYVNPHGVPLLTSAVGTYLPTSGSRNGVWMMTLPTDELKFFIPNDTMGTGLKTVYIQVTFFDAQFTGPSVFLNSSSFNGQLFVDSANILSDGWTHARYKATFGPCPSSETITLKGFTAGAIAIVDQVVIDTICNPVPEPATMATLLLGPAFMAIRRRKRRS